MGKLKFVLLLGVVLGILSVATTLAQSDQSQVCDSIVDDALVQIGDFCDSMDRNSACYGYNEVTSSFFVTNHPEFNTPSDRVELTQLQTIQTSPLNIDDGRWGIAVLNARANLPMTAPGQNVVMLLVGDATLENDITPQTVVDVNNTVEAVTQYNANLREGPTTQSSIVTVARAETTLAVDMLSWDGRWLRVPQPEGNVAWISRDVVTIDAETLDSLAAPNPTRISPMQAFYFTGGLGQASCARAESTVYIQGPNNIRVDLNVNGAQVTIGSTIAIDFEDDSTMRVSTLSGMAYVDGIVVPAGHFVSAQLDENRTIIADTWSVLQGIDRTMAAQFALIEDVPANLLHYEVELMPPYASTNITPVSSGAVNNTTIGDNANGGGDTNGNGGGNGNGTGGDNSVINDAPGGNGCNGQGNCSGNVNGDGNCNGQGNANCNGNGNGNNDDDDDDDDDD